MFVGLLTKASAYGIKKAIQTPTVTLPPPCLTVGRMFLLRNSFSFTSDADLINLNNLSGHCFVSHIAKTITKKLTNVWLPKIKEFFVVVLTLITKNLHRQYEKTWVTRCFGQRLQLKSKSYHKKYYKHKHCC